MMDALTDDAGRYRSGGVGVFGESGLIHMAPPPQRVPELMGDLFAWLKKSKDHLLIRSCVFHYEFEFIHPFSDGNGRTGRLWQSLILGRLNPLFEHLPVENMVYANLSLEERDYISLTDMATAKEGDNRSADIIKNWLRNRYTIEFLGTWEVIHNPDFKVVEFDHFRMSAGLPSFVLSASEWIERTNAIGIIVKKGRYGGTYAHKDIAFEFGSAISVPFKLYLIEEFQRLKTEEQRLLGWSAKRELSKINYRIHTDAIKQNLVPAEVTPAQASIIYASEADVLNVAMFGVTAKQWREANPDLKGNIRDYATINELICLSNMENLNAVFIEQGMTQGERLVKLNQIAIHQMSVLESGDNDRKLLK